MENASKALIMAAEILIGVMVISIAVYLFNVLGQYGADTTEQIQESQLQQFNNQFLKYYGNTSTQTADGKIVVEPIKCTMQDIVGLANLAKKINESNGFSTTQAEQRSDNSYYIQIDLQIGTKPYKNIEAREQKDLLNLLRDDGNYGILIEEDELGDKVAKQKYFKALEPGISETTKRVNYMKFVYDPDL